jgi:hypothetical protein
LVQACCCSGDASGVDASADAPAPPEASRPASELPPAPADPPVPPAPPVLPAAPPVLPPVPPVLPPTPPVLPPDPPVEVLPPVPPLAPLPPEPPPEPPDPPDPVMSVVVRPVVVFVVPSEEQPIAATAKKKRHLRICFLADVVWRDSRDHC